MLVMVDAVIKSCSSNLIWLFSHANFGSIDREIIGGVFCWSFGKTKIRVGVFIFIAEYNSGHFVRT